MADLITNLACARGKISMNGQGVAMPLAYKALEYVIVARKTK